MYQVVGKHVNEPKIMYHHNHIHPRNKLRHICTIALLYYIIQLYIEADILKFISSILYTDNDNPYLYDRMCSARSKTSFISL